MNKYEALRALDLDDTATEQDVRLAYYGIDKAIATQSFEGEDKLGIIADNFKSYSLEARDYLLANGMDAGGEEGIVDKVFRKKVKTESLKVSSQDDAWARLSGLQLLRVRLLSYREGKLSKVRGSVVTLVLCIVISFIVLRYLRATPRVVVEIVLVAIIVFASVILTDAQKQSKIVRSHVFDIDDRMHELKMKLGLDDPNYVPPDQRVEGNWFTRALKRVRQAFHNLAEKIRARMNKGDSDE